MRLKKTSGVKFMMQVVITRVRHRVALRRMTPASDTFQFMLLCRCELTSLGD